MSGQDVLLATKLHIPRPQPGFVRRRRQLQALGEGLARGRVLVCAPAGFGKTMTKEIQTQAGRCSTHGTVEAVREIPKMGFPFVVYAIWRAAAQRRPFLCPECGAAVQAH
jgi:hypothetical protein